MNGNWIHYEIYDNTFIVALSSGFNEHWHDNIINQYRPLKHNEYNGIKIRINEVIDTIDGAIYHTGEYYKILDRIPPDKYYITSKGNYLNDLKNGKWTYYYKSGKIRKEILYNNNMPKSSFKIFRENETLMIAVFKISDLKWKVCRYSESGAKISCEIKQIDDIKILY
jgi:hypothetical protein